MDFGSQYHVTDAFSVYFNAKNLTNTALKLTEGPGENRVIQREFFAAARKLLIDVQRAVLTVSVTVSVRVR